MDAREPPRMRSRRPRGDPFATALRQVAGRRGGAALAQQPPGRVLLHHGVVDDVPVQLVEGRVGPKQRQTKQGHLASGRVPLLALYSIASKWTSPLRWNNARLVARAPFELRRSVHKMIFAPTNTTYLQDLHLGVPRPVNQHYSLRRGLG